MKNIAIIYGSSTDNTKNVAQKIAQKLSGENVLLKDVSTVTFNRFVEQSHSVGKCVGV